MAQVHHYSHPTTPAGPGFDTVIDDVAILPSHKFTAAASVGDASVVKVTVDDPALEHEFVGLNRWFVVEDLVEGETAETLIWNGYIADQSVTRAGDSIVFPSGRSWGLDLVETSTILGFRIITAEDGDRPAETASERLAWLMLASDYLMTVGDNGLVDWDGLEDFDMDENDYRGQTPRDVISDIAVRSQFNYWAYYDPDADEDMRINLALFHPDAETYTSTVRISNDPADEGAADTYMASMDAELVRKPDRIAAGGYLPYDGGAVYDYDYDTADEFAFRDRSFPMASVKTEALAEDLLADLLETFDEQDERITDQILVPAANINDVKHGHRIQVKYTHFPAPYNDRTWVRVVRKTFAPPENKSQDWYVVDLEMVPTVPAPTPLGEPTGAFGYWTPGYTAYATPVLDSPTTPGNILFLIISQCGTVSGLSAPTTPEFHLDPTFPTVPGAIDATWTELAFTNANSASSGNQRIAYGIYWREINAGEVTTTPVGIRPRPHDNYRIGAWLWEMDSSVTFGAATTYSTDTDGVKDEGETITVGSSLTGFVVGGFCVGIPDFHDGLVVTPTSGDTVMSRQSTNDASVGPFGGHTRPAWTWIAKLDAGGQLVASFVSPYAVETNRAVAGAAVEITGIDELPALLPAFPA